MVLCHGTTWVNTRVMRYTNDRIYHMILISPILGMIDDDQGDQSNQSIPDTCAPPILEDCANIGPDALPGSRNSKDESLDKVCKS